jgi:hypothetical protein
MLECTKDSPGFMPAALRTKYLSLAQPLGWYEADCIVFIVSTCLRVITYCRDLSAVAEVYFAVKTSRRRVTPSKRAAALAMDPSKVVSSQSAAKEPKICPRSDYQACLFADCPYILYYNLLPCDEIKRKEFVSFFIHPRKTAHLHPNF